MKALLRIAVVFGLLQFASGVPISDCCSLVSGSCRSACEQISLVSIATDAKERQLRLNNLNHYCARELTNFWTCVNNSLQDIQRGEGWAGRICCPLPQARSCRLACLQAQSRSDLAEKCRQSDESKFFNCVETQEDGERCCSNAQTPDCRKACKAVFTSRRSPTRKIRNAAMQTCAHSPKVLRCVQNFAKFTPAINPQRSEYPAPSPATSDLHCCEKSPNEQCRNVCIHALRTRSTDQEIVELIEAACGPILPSDKMWQCFLHYADPPKSTGTPTSSISRMGMDSAKLQCCFKAVAPECQRHCFRTFSNDWTNSWGVFDRQCQEEKTEFKMLMCLAEVDEPCEVGCEGLSYCTNFNNRPTELFQSCSSQADRAAQRDVKLWQRQYINMPMMQIPVLDTSRCHPNLWKAIACTLQIKPCRRHTHPSMICKSDCIEVLSKCLDYSRLPPGQTAESLCEHLSPSDDTKSCITLAPYLVKSLYISTALVVTHPCRPNPCNASNICIINRDCPPNEICLPFQCIPGCKMGDISPLVVPFGAVVRIPTPSSITRCHKVCRCSERLLIEDCQPEMCIQPENCWHKGIRIDHGTVFEAECNQCMCFAGEVTCTQKTCIVDGRTTSVTFSGLPCNCAPHYVPVCGINGKTYPSACLARCSGLQHSQSDFGSCSSFDPCSTNVCAAHQRCVPKKAICLNIKHRICTQFECVDNATDCSAEPNMPVCDEQNQEYKNLCWLLHENSSLAYRGKCKSSCNHVGVVCGHNGETYPSECAALADKVTIDYEGPCVTVGSLTDTANPRCTGVRCPALVVPHCTQVVPPGACCPICGGGLQILFSRLQVEHTLASLYMLDQLTVRQVAEHLQRHVQIAECDVFAYLSVHGALVVVVAPALKWPIPVQVDACAAEAEKLALLIQNSSPLLQTDIVLSYLVSAETLHTQSSATASAGSFSFSLVTSILLVTSTLFLSS